MLLVTWWFVTFISPRTIILILSNYFNVQKDAIVTSLNVMQQKAKKTRENNAKEYVHMLFCIDQI